MKSHRIATFAIAGVLVLTASAMAQAPPGNSPESNAATAAAAHDGAHDFDFLIGDWKAHVRRLPDRLVGSNVWLEYDGVSKHHKILDSDANFEEFEVWNKEKNLHIKAQTLRLYSPESHQWSIYLLDVNNGALSLPPVVGQFEGNRGEFYDQELWKGRAILVRYVWLNLSPHAARMEQSFSPDGGKNWEINWICELSR